MWRGGHSSLTVEEVLGRVVSAIADEGLRVDHQPGSALRAQNVPGVKVGGQYHVIRRRSRQFLENAEPRLDQARINPSPASGPRLLRPGACSSSMAFGSCPSQAIRSGIPWQAAASCSGMRITPADRARAAWESADASGGPARGIGSSRGCAGSLRVNTHTTETRSRTPK